MTSTTKQQAADNFSQGLGFLVWWDLENSRCTPDHLRNILASEGEDPSVVPEVDKVSGLRRAVRKFRQGRQVGSWKTEIVPDADKDVIRVGLLEFQQVADDEVRWVQRATTTWHIKRSAWDTVDADSAETMDRVQDFYQFARLCQNYHDHLWITPNLIQARVLACGSFPLRRQGGVTYVPAEFQAELEKLSRMVSQIGDSSFSMVRAQADGRSRASLAGSASRSLEAAIREQREQLDTWLAGTVRARHTSVTDAIETFAQLRSSAQLYADTLSMEAEAFMDEIAEASAEAEELLGLVEDRAAENYKVSDRTMGKLQKAIVPTGGDPNVAVLDVDSASAAQLGSSWVYALNRWTGGQRHWTAAKALGWKPVQVTEGRIVLERLTPVSAAS